MRRALFILLVCFCALFAPELGYAVESDYSIEELSCALQVQPDSSVHVVERQIIRFDNENEGYTWYLHVPEQGESVKIDSVSAAPVDDGGTPSGDWIRLQMYDVDATAQGRRPGDIASATLRAVGTQPWYSYSISDGMVRSWFPIESNAYVIEASYTISNRVRIYRDVAELYWRYAHGSLPVDSHDITFLVALPVPEGVPVVAGEDVLAWGHGPNEGGFEVGPDGTVVYHLSQLSSGQYAEAHIVFPSSWMTNISANNPHVYSELHRQTALNEEGEWVDSFARGAHWDYQVRVLFLAIAAVVIAVGVICVARFGRTYRSRRAVIRSATTLAILALGAHLFFAEPFTVRFLLAAAAVLLVVALALPRYGSDLAAEPVEGFEADAVMGPIGESGPGEPEEPHEPAETGEPGEHKEPGEPAEPDESGEPGEPEESGEPGEPAETGDPEGPANEPTLDDYREPVGGRKTDDPASSPEGLEPSGSAGSPEGREPSGSVGSLEEREPKAPAEPIDEQRDTPEEDTRTSQ